LATEQAMQVPVHGWSQQTPSTQLPEVHWALDVQLPFACFCWQNPREVIQ
jgi:hypothetical protein